MFPATKTPFPHSCVGMHTCRTHGNLPLPVSNVPGGGRNATRPHVRKLLSWVLALCLLLPASGCAVPRLSRVTSVALTLQDVAAAASRQSDPIIVAEGSPAYIMLVEGLLEAYPDNREFLLAACRAYSSYAASFVVDDDPVRAGRLFLRAKDYGFKALSNHADFSATAASDVEAFEALLMKYETHDVPELFWTANAWAGWISLNLDRLEAVADLPALEALMERILELDEGFYHGSPHVLMGVYQAARPTAIGGGPQKARAHFDKAFRLGAHKLLTTKVLFAEYYARSIRDEALFVETLEEVLAASPDAVPELRLANILAQRRAEKLLSRREEYFAELP